jgi:hypothetical protein
MGGGGCVGIGDGVGYTIVAVVAVGVKVEGGSVAVGRAVWVRAMPVRAIARAVFCAFFISSDCGLVPQAVRKATKIIRMYRDFIVIGNLLYLMRV